MRLHFFSKIIRQINITRLCCSVIWGILFSFGTYWTTTLPEQLLFESFQLSKLEKYNPNFSKKNRNWNESVIMIDVHYDKIIAEEIERSISPIDNTPVIAPVGNVAVTDHRKLLELLKYLHTKSDYRFVILDIILDDDIPQEVDDSLRDLIIQMPRLLIPTPDDDNIRAISLLDKSGEVSYIKFKQQLTKFPYILDERKSLPLKMYEDLYRHEMNEHSFLFYKWYTDKEELCTSTLFLTYEFQPPISIQAQRDSKEYDIYQLGLGLLKEDSVSDRGLDELETKNKYILIGDFEEDIHQTIVGGMSGTAILFNAYLSLVNDKHRIGWPFIFFLLISLSALSYYTLSINPFEPPKTKPIIKSWPALLWTSLCRFIGWFYVKIGLFVGLICYVTYIWQNTIYNIFIISSCFVVLKWLNRINKAWNLRKNTIDFFNKWWLQ